MIAAVCVTVAVCIAPIPDVPTEPSLVAHAAHAEERQALRDIAHAYDVVAFVDALTEPELATTTLGPEATGRRRPLPAASAPVAGTGACGGDLPDCSIMNCESGGSLTSENPSSSAAGKWQFIQSTANNLARAMGRPDLVGVPASQWTETEQDDAARILWRGGAGRSNWQQCL